MKIASARDFSLWMLIVSITSVASIGFMKWLGADAETAVWAAAAMTAIVLFGCAAYQRKNNL